MRYFYQIKRIAKNKRTENAKHWKDMQSKLNDHTCLLEVQSSVAIWNQFSYMHNNVPLLDIHPGEMTSTACRKTST